MKCFITGGEGFVGKHLAKLLNDEGLQVVTFDLKDSRDILNRSQLLQALNAYRPDYIFHLAAVTSIPESFSDAAHCVDVNLIGTINLLDCIREADLSPRILLASSTEVYSPSFNDTPLNTSSPLQPRTPYGVSKLAMEQIGAIYANTYKLQIAVTRTNNHTGPGQDGPFAVTSFAKQIAEIEKGKRNELKHGDLTSFKSYLDVRDVIRAYRIAIDLPPFIYNIAADDNIEMQELLNRLVAQAKVPINTSTDTSLVRPSSPDRTRYETSSKLREAGWKPEYNIERTLRDVLDYWRERV